LKCQQKQTSLLALNAAIEAARAELMARVGRFRVETGRIGSNDPMNRGPNPSEAGTEARPLMQRIKPV
jgi:hypothetical protein